MVAVQIDFLLAWLSSVITSNDWAEILNNHSLNTVDNADKILEKWKLCEFCWEDHIWAIKSAHMHAWVVKCGEL